MAYWCDDRALDLEQRRLDAAQDDALRRLLEEARTKHQAGQMTDDDYHAAIERFRRWAGR